MVISWQLFGKFFLIAGLLSSCTGLNLPSLPASLKPDDLLKIIPLQTRKRVKVVFYNRLSNNELVPLVPDTLESLRFNGQFSLDAGSFPRHKGLEQTFPFIEAGEHLIELTFQNQKKPVEIPIVVPESSTEETVILVILSFDTGGELIRDVQVGYDMNNDHLLDQNMNIYRSSNGQIYLVYAPDGQVQEWNSPLDYAATDQVPTQNNAALPPGSSNRQSGTEPPPKNANLGSEKPAPLPVPKLPTPKPLPLPEPLPGILKSIYSD